MKECEQSRAGRPDWCKTHERSVWSCLDFRRREAAGDADKVEALSDALLEVTALYSLTPGASPEILEAACGEKLKRCRDLGAIVRDYLLRAPSPAGVEANGIVRDKGTTSAVVNYPGSPYDYRLDLPQDQLARVSVGDLVRVTVQKRGE